jgi:hypothetical protein
VGVEEEDTFFERGHYLGSVSREPPLTLTLSPLTWGEGTDSR